MCVVNLDLTLRVAAGVKGVYCSMWELKVGTVVPDEQCKVEIYIMNGMIVLRLLSDTMLKGQICRNFLLHYYHYILKFLELYCPVHILGFLNGVSSHGLRSPWSSVSSTHKELTNRDFCSSRVADFKTISSQLPRGQ